MNFAHLALPPQGISWRFVRLFALYSGGMLVLLHLSPLSLMQYLAEATASATVFFWSIFSIPLVQNGLFISYLGFPMEIVVECTAIHYIIIAGSGILAYPSHSTRYKMSGLAVIGISIFLLNLVRIGILGFVGHYALRIFPFVHIFVWQGLFSFLVILLWIYWVRGEKLHLNIAWRYLLRGLTGLIISYWFFSLTLPYYVQVLAGVVNMLSQPISLLFDMPSRVLGSRGFIMYLVNGTWLQYQISNDIMNTISFCTLSAIFVSRQDIVRHLKMFSSGLSILFIMHTGYVVMYGALCVHGIDENLFGDITRGLAFVAPFLVWLLLSRFIRAEPEQ